MRTKSWTPRPPAPASRSCSGFTPARRCCASARLLFSTGGKATVYVIGFYRSDRHTLLIRRFRK
jgi:hypothetical protein